MLFRRAAEVTLELRELADGVLLQVRVQPSAKRSTVLGVHGGALRVAVAAPPVDGKANAALVEFLRELLRVKRSQVSIHSGEKSRDKTVLITGVKADDIRNRTAMDHKSDSGATGSAS